MVDQQTSHSRADSSPKQSKMVYGVEQAPTPSPISGYTPGEITEKETTVRDLCTQAEQLARTSGSADYAVIKQQLDALVDKAKSSPKIQNAIARFGEVQFREHIAGYFSSSFEEIHGRAAPDGKNALDRCVAWCSNAVHFLKTTFQEGARITQKIHQFMSEAIKDSIAWVSDIKNWQALGESVAKVAGSIWDTVKKTTIAFFEEIKETLSDPRKRAEFLRKLLSGELYIDLTKKIFEGAWMILCAASEGLGINDLGRSGLALLKGDPQAAWEHLKKAGTKLADAVGLTNLYRFSELMIKAVETGDKSYFYQALQEGAIGAVKVAITVVTVGEGAAAIHAIKSAAISLSYRGVAVAAEQVTIKQLAQTGSSLVKGVINREEREILGMKAADKIADATESLIGKRVDKIAGRNTYEKALEAVRRGDSDVITLPKNLIERIEKEFLDPTKRKQLLAEVAAEAQKVGASSAEELMSIACKKLKVKDGSKFQKMVRKQVLDEQDFRNLETVVKAVRQVHPDMSEQEIRRTAKAVQHMLKNNWYRSGKAKAQYSQNLANSMTDELVKDGIEDGFKARWTTRRETMKESMDRLGVKLSDGVWEEIDDAAWQGYKKGFSKWLEQFLKDEKKTRRHNSKAKKSDKREMKTPSDDTGMDPLEVPPIHADIHDGTIDANTFAGVVDHKRRGRTLEDEILDFDKERQRIAQTRRIQPDSGSKPTGAPATQQGASDKQHVSV